MKLYLTFSALGFRTQEQSPAPHAPTAAGSFSPLPPSPASRSSRLRGQQVASALILCTLALTGCQDDPSDPFLCDPNFLSIDGDCEEPWYDSWWRRGSQWTQDTSSQYLGDFLDVDVKQELERRIASSQVFYQARDKLRALQTSGLSDLSIGSLMRVLQDPHSLNTLADFLRDGGPSAYELYSQAVTEGGPYLDHLRQLLEQSVVSHNHGVQGQEYVDAVIGAIERYRAGL
jgi:hypothetical protein